MLLPAGAPARIALVIGAVLACLGLVAQSAVASPLDGHPYRHGAVPQHLHASRPALPGTAANASPFVRSRHNPHRAGAATTSTNNLSYGGGVGGIGVTTGQPEVYVVFWGSQWGTASTSGNYTTLSGDPQGIAPQIQKFFAGLGSEPSTQNWSGVLTQYCEGVAAGSQVCPSGAAHVGAPPAGGVLKGVWVDGSAAAPSAATGKQIATEALAAATYFGKNATTSRNAQYVIVSPHGTNPDNYKSPITGYCAWHDYTGDSSLSGGAASSVANAVAFTNMPYLTDVGTSCGQNFVNAGSAGTLDGVTIVGGHEYAETVTDQFPAGGWTDSTGNENGDKCAWIKPGSAGGSGNLPLSTGTFAVQTTWGNDGNSGQGACQMTHPTVGAAPSAGTLKIQMPTQFQAGSQAGSVQLLDPSGTNPMNASSNITVTLSSTGAGTFGSQSITIPSGSNSASFTYTDQKAENTTITAAASNYTSGSQSETVTPGPATSLTTITPGSASLAPGASQTFTASGKDQYGNATSDTSGTTWSTSVPGGTVSPGSGSSTVFTANGAGGGNVTAKLIANGSTSTANAAVTVGSQVVLNGDFESGTLAGWTTGGNQPTPAVVAKPHSGAYSAQLGYTPSTGEPRGDSSIQQTVTVPAAGGTLSFWAWRFTTDSISYDWQTCQVRNTSGSTLATIFKTASNAQAWQQLSYSLSNWKSQKVVIWCNVHEDGYGDQTYMNVDDFAVK